MRLTRIILLVWAASATHVAFAHAELSESVPADRATLAAAPDNVTLRFSEAVRLTALSVQRDGAAKQSLGPLPADASEQFSVALPALENGHYTVAWRALSADTHVMTGELMFAVGAIGDHDQHMRHDADADSQARQDAHAGAH